MVEGILFVFSSPNYISPHTIIYVFMLKMEGKVLIRPVKIFDNNNNDIYDLDINEASALIAISNMPYSFPDEALKAQIIMARTFLSKKIRSLGGEGCSLHKEADICRSSHCIFFYNKDQLFSCWGKESLTRWKRISSLVCETREQIAVMNGNPILPIFHKACGGSTENSENINGIPITYLRKTFCDYCKENSKDMVNIDINIEEIENLLNTKTNMLNWQIGPEIKGIIENAERDEEGRIKKIKIGNTIYKGQEIIEKLGIGSTRFGWKPKVITFESKGFGSGLGLCQHGAKCMALEGKTAQEILKTYFTGIDIISLKRYEPSKLLDGRKFLLDPGNGAKVDEIYLGRDSMLDICCRIKKKLLLLGAEVHLTRNTNAFCSMKDKVMMADAINPEFYIGINCNYEKNCHLSGTDIFHFRGDTESRTLADFIMNRLILNTTIVQKGVKVAELSLFKEIKGNAILIELGYMSNLQDKKILEDEKGKEKISEAITEGIKNFYK